LLWVLREELELTGTKYGCGIGVCGVRTVHLDGAAVPSRILPVGQAEGAAVTMIEGLIHDGALHPVQQAWLDAEVPQCGYCQPGMIMAIVALLRENPHPTDEALRLPLGSMCSAAAAPIRVCCGQSVPCFRHDADVVVAALGDAVASEAF
jgi:isoquinoline 1-oxidoreductase alpha subunit